jgi:pimeloyl-ACP methyl ester carboxylesterase
VHIIPETAHCPFDERPEAFADVVLPWIAGL